MVSLICYRLWSVGSFDCYFISLGIYSADPTNAQYNEFAARLNGIGGFAMSMMVPILSAFIAESIAKRPGLVVGFVGD